MAIGLLIFAIILIIVGGVLYFQSKKELDTDDPQEFKRIKSKWQIIFGLLGLAIVVVAGISIYLMFNI